MPNNLFKLYVYLRACLLSSDSTENYYIIHLEIYIERYELTGDVSSPSGGDRVNRTANSCAGAFSSVDTATDIFLIEWPLAPGSKEMVRVVARGHKHACNCTTTVQATRSIIAALYLHVYWEAISVSNPVSEEATKIIKRALSPWLVSLASEKRASLHICRKKKLAERQK